MTNRHMVKKDAADADGRNNNRPAPNPPQPQPRPAPESESAVWTREEPLDSPGPKPMIPQEQKGLRAKR